ncbi:MAG: bifunctional adenosylcobinamide kinase/adenosylcobinamide-phosphate guanylyltransferase [Leptolyngbyaceae cyanobacterium MO_188.B28]|nr:bifunctional adenosylcobinamide kinase/adenosylcobinamide-phosphate guanylyltransferase [Leptolyngbyaceae cyanobacterium MO_188.B28]
MDFTIASPPNSIHRITLITGPSRSGKSEWAEQLAIQSDKPVTYVATAQNREEDAEWRSRIQQHQQRRPASWRTVEAPSDLACVIESAHPDHCLLIDSLGTWLANYWEHSEEDWQTIQTAFLASLIQTANQIILVAEETGWGVVPAYPSGRIFRDRLGGLIRSVGAIADPVYLVTGGYALNLRELGTPI